MPLIGANVFVEGSKTGVSTDFDGKFQVDLPSEKSAIVVSYIGFKDNRLDVTGKYFVEIKMEAVANELQETVIVGYGTQKKSTLTGAIGTINGGDLNKRSVVSMSTALQGTVAGVTVQQTSGEPGSDGSSIRVRGIGSVNSNTAPLVLVDGIEMDINQVDMNAVENVSVLKDAASASIYGSRASNGVILITTKRGKDGKMRVSIDAYTSIQSPTNMPTVLSAADYLQAELNSLDNIGTVIPADQRAARSVRQTDRVRATGARSVSIPGRRAPSTDTRPRASHVADSSGLL
jgi:TonB-dependent SusC/RagA subfamily outer membrane receptor